MGCYIEAGGWELGEEANEGQRGGERGPPQARPPSLAAPHGRGGGGGGGSTAATGARPLARNTSGLSVAQRLNSARLMTSPGSFDNVAHALVAKS